MKTINLYTVSSMYTSGCEIDLIRRYFKLKENEVKSSEIEDLVHLVEDLESGEEGLEIGNFDCFYHGYSIKNISKEFDLLRFGTQCIINIEIKRKADIETIGRQLKQNKYYLKFLNKKLELYSYISEERQLYKLNDTNQVEQVNIDNLIGNLKKQNIDLNIDINSLFKINNYLVSPFNSTKKYIEGEYFLTDHQNQFKKKIISIIDTNVDNYNLLGLKGKAGTGKTLLLYDIYKELISKGLNVLILHCGKLNDGQKVLIEKYEYNIKCIKSIDIMSLDNYDIILCDESQRIRYYQFEKINCYIQNSNKTVIYCYDPKQCLSNQEKSMDFETKIDSEITHNIFSLSSKIRTNKEISEFIKCLFEYKKIDTNKKIENMKDYVKIEFFDNRRTALQYVDYLKEEDWKAIHYTVSIHNQENIDSYVSMSNMNAHDAIGQEFDKVVTVLDNNFLYDSFDNLRVRKTYYNLDGMLFQILTRTREKLCLVIIDNIALFDKISLILESYSI